MANRRRISATAVDQALAKSVLGTLPAEMRNTISQDAIRIDLPAGAALYRDDDEPRCGLVIAGLIRVYMTSPEGRQITVRYARDGELLGIAAIVGGPAPVSAQVLTDATLLMLNPQTLQRLGQTEPKVGWVIAQEVTRRLYDTLEALAGDAFGTLRQRVARHLLDLAASRQQGRGLVVNVTQQELADAVGSVRPVVARVIRDLRVEGILTNSSDGIIVLRPAELLTNTWSGAP